MARDDLGVWRPLPLRDVVELFADAPFRWWISGGHALELHVGRSWRRHDDVDVAVVRDDGPAVFAHLAGWCPHVGAAGVLTPWDGSPLDAAAHHNNVWCRRLVDGPWELDVTVGDGTTEEWVYRRDPSVRRPWDSAVLRTDDGIPYLAPELQLLFKSRGMRPKDDIDAAEVIPALDSRRRAALAELLPADHPWRSRSS